MTTAVSSNPVLPSTPAVRDAVARVRAAVEGLRGVPSEHDELGELHLGDLVAIAGAADLLQLAFAERAARYADTFDDTASDVPVTEVLKRHCRMGGAAVRNALQVGAATADSLGASRSALERGELGFANLALLVDTALAATDSPTGRPFDEQRMLRHATSHGVAEFRRYCRHERHAHDAEAFLREEVEAVELRRLRLIPFDGGLSVHGIFDTEGAAVIRSALEPFARPDGPDDHRCVDRRNADALVEVMGHSLDEGYAPRGRRAPHLQVTVPLQTLIGRDDSPAGALELGGLIGSVSAQRLACEATVSRIVLGPDAAVVEVGHAKRVPGPATRRALAARDGGCVWPGCGMVASRTQAHHVIHWVRGGATELDNLVLLCRRHHWRVHDGGWKIAREATGRVYTVPPIPDFGDVARTPSLLGA